MKEPFLWSPRESSHWVWEQPPLAFGCPAKRAEREKRMNLNQLTIIGFIGRSAETKQRPNRSIVAKFSVATTKSWKNEKGERKQRTQWDTVLGFGQGFTQLAARLVKAGHVFVQGELTTREYDRPITVPSGKKSIEHVIQQLAVELKADTIRLLDRTNAPASGEVTEQITED